MLRTRCRRHRYGIAEAASRLLLGYQEASAKVWTNAAGDVSDDAKTVIEEVAGVDRVERSV